MSDYQEQFGGGPFDDEDDFGDDYGGDSFEGEDGFSELTFDEDAEGDAGEGDAGDDDSLGDDLLGDDLLGDDAEGATTTGADGEQLAWRETYFVLFQRDHRPTLTQVEGALADADPRLKIENLQADDDGLFQSLLIQAPEDNAALEVSYESGDAVIEQSTELAKHLENQLESDQLAQLLRSDARFDVMHFERMANDASFEDADPSDEGVDPLMLEALDPATLITVVEALSDLTEGLPVDPAAGELLT